jgi:hypothetical protein
MTEAEAVQYLSLRGWNRVGAPTFKGKGQWEYWEFHDFGSDTPCTIELARDEVIMWAEQLRGMERPRQLRMAL